MISINTVEELEQYALRHNPVKDDRRWDIRVNYSGDNTAGPVYVLVEVGPTLYYRDRAFILLGKDLASKLLEFWPYKTSTHFPDMIISSSRFTILGILKRLGRTEFVKNVAALKRKQKEDENMRVRESVRFDVADLVIRVTRKLERAHELGILKTMPDLTDLLMSEEEWKAANE